jgi:hypothetical protein
VSVFEWVGIIGIATGQVGAVLVVVWRFGGWMARIEYKIDEVMMRTLSDHEDRLRRLEGR